MGKNHRHKKALKADKAKVKLKQTKTKFLPKGQNVTNTQFKIKPIVLTQQLKEKTGDSPLSKRKLDIKDLLSRLRHYNENIRHLACEELSEMLKSYPMETMTHLSQVILSVSSLMQDKESKVRKATEKTIKVILQVFPEDKLEPFYNYFVINLCCAMSNINPKIQEDSLKYLDCFINRNIGSSCGLITKYSEKILPELLALISKIHTDSTLKRTLTINLGGSMSSVTWKIKVLIELLNVIKSISKKSNRQLIKESNIIHVDNSSKLCWFGLYKNGFGNVLEQSNWNWDSINDSQKNSSNILEKNILTIVPLLYESWLEVMPEIQANKSENISTPLEVEAAAVLIIILRMWNALENYALNHRLDNKMNGTKECEKLFDSLILHFPYCSKDSKTMSALNNLGLLEPNPSQRFILLNIELGIFYIKSKIIVKKNVPQREQKVIYSYINKCLLNKNLDEQNIQILFVFIRHCTKLWKKPNAALTEILENTIDIFGSTEDKFISSNLQTFKNILDNLRN